MALKSHWSKKLPGFDTPAEIANAYIKVATVTGSKEYASAVVFVYAEKPVIAKNPDEQIPFFPVDEATFHFTPSVSSEAKNFIAQAYEHLKTLPEFDGATEC